MNRALKPEDEREVTPGKQAVHDLEGLPSVDLEFITLPKVTVRDGEGYSLEEHENLKVRAMPHRNENTVALVTLQEARELAKTKSERVPSAPLFFTVLRHLYEGRVDPRYRFVLEQLNYQQDSELLPTDPPLAVWEYLTDTSMDYPTHGIEHYPPRPQGDALWFAALPRDTVSFSKILASRNSREFFENIIGQGNCEALDSIAKLLAKEAVMVCPGRYPSEPYDVYLRCTDNKLEVRLTGDERSARMYRSVVI